MRNRAIRGMLVGKLLFLLPRYEAWQTTERSEGSCDLVRHTGRLTKDLELRIYHGVCATWITQLVINLSPPFLK